MAPAALWRLAEPPATRGPLGGLQSVGFGSNGFPPAAEAEAAAREVEVPHTTTAMPTSTPLRPTRGAAYSTPPSSSDADFEGGCLRPSLFALASPSFQGCHRKEQEEGTCSRTGIPQRMRHHSGEHSNNADTEDLSSLENSLSAWEEWFICKEKELRARFQAQALEAMHKEMEKMKENEEREKKKIIAAEKHREWVQRKNEEVKREKRERERKLSKEMAEKAAKELKKAQSKEKAREVYLEWLKKKNTEEVQKKKDEKEKEKQLEAELQEKKQKSEKMFKEWLQNTKQKARPESAVDENGKFTGFPDGSIYPAPSFCNPIPWKPIHVPPPKEEKYVSVKKNKRPIPSHSHRHSSMLLHKSKNDLYIGPLCRIKR